MEHQPTIEETTQQPEIKTFPENYAPESVRLIVTPSAFAREHFIYVQETGRIKLESGRHFTQRRNLQSYLLVAIQSGRGTLHYAGKVYTLKGGEFFLIDCRLPHAYESDQAEPWSLSWAHFYGGGAAGYYALLDGRHGPVFTSPEAVRMNGLLLQMIERNKTQSIETEIENARLLTELLSHAVLAGAAQSMAGKQSEQMRAVRDYLRETFARPHTLDSVAQRFFMSKYHLAHEFKACYGETIVQYITHKRITQAKHLLRFTDQSIAQIAEACGFHESSYFNRQFRKAEGVSASAYRVQWRDA